MIGRRSRAVAIPSTGGPPTYDGSGGYSSHGDIPVPVVLAYPLGLGLAALSLFQRETYRREHRWTPAELAEHDAAVAALMAKDHARVGCVWTYQGSGRTCAYGHTESVPSAVTATATVSSVEVRSLPRELTAHATDDYPLPDLEPAERQLEGVTR